MIILAKSEPDVVGKYHTLSYCSYFLLQKHNAHGKVIEKVRHDTFGYAYKRFLFLSSNKVECDLVKQALRVDNSTNALHLVNIGNFKRHIVFFDDRRVGVIEHNITQNIDLYSSFILFGGHVLTIGVMPAKTIDEAVIDLITSNKFEVIFINPFLLNLSKEAWEKINA